MRTLLIVLGLAVSTLATAEARAPTDDEIQQLDIIQQSWIFQG